MDPILATPHRRLKCCVSHNIKYQSGSEDDSDGYLSEAALAQ